MSEADLSEFEILQQRFESLDAHLREQVLKNENLQGTIQHLQDEQAQAANNEFERNPPPHPEPQVIFVAQERHIGRFQGKPGSDIHLGAWIQDIKSYLEVRPQPGKNAIRFIKDHLAGPARIEIDGHDDVKNPEDIFSILHHVFTDSGNDQQKRLRLFGRRQEPDESLLTYSHELIRLHQQLENDQHYREQKEQNLAAIFVEGVRDPLLSRELNRQMLTNPNDSFFKLRDWAVDWHKRGSSRDPRIRHAMVKESVGKTCLPQEVQIKEASSDGILSVLQQQGNMLREHMNAQRLQNDAVLQLLKRVDSSRHLSGTLGTGIRPSIREPRPSQPYQPWNTERRPTHSSSPQMRPLYPHQGQRRRGSCFNCGGVGHFIRDCPKHNYVNASLNN